jgi:hypothetical protein
VLLEKVAHELMRCSDRRRLAGCFAGPNYYSLRQSQRPPQSWLIERRRRCAVFLISGDAKFDKRTALETPPITPSDNAFGRDDGEDGVVRLRLLNVFENNSIVHC